MLELDSDNAFPDESFPHIRIRRQAPEAVLYESLTRAEVARVSFASGDLLLCNVGFGVFPPDGIGTLRCSDSS